MARRTDAPRRAAGLFPQIARRDIAGPVAVVAVVLAMALGLRLVTYDGDPAGFVGFGERFVARTEPPPGAPIRSPRGYDGQFFWIQAGDPLVAEDATIRRLAGAEFRLQRMAYPALAYVLAAGRESAIAWTLLAINVLVVLGITWGFAAYARTRGWSGWWALAVGLLPGLVLATMRDLSDPLALAGGLGGLILWQMRKRWWAAGFLTVAVLAREPMVLAVVAVALSAAALWWRRRDEPGAPAELCRTTWPSVVIPAAAFAAWQLYINHRYGGIVAAHGPAYLPPFQAIFEQLKEAVDDGSVLRAAWELAYIGLMLAAFAATVRLIRRERSAALVAALLFSMSLLFLKLDDVWGYTRLSAPVFAFLLLAALEVRSRFALAVCASAAAMTILMPLALGTSGGA